MRSRITPRSDPVRTLKFNQSREFFLLKFTMVRLAVFNLFTHKVAPDLRNEVEDSLK